MKTKEIKNNTKYTPGLTNKHDESFLKKYTPESFLEEMNKKRKDIHPDFLTQFDKYTSEVSSLLSENISVVASRVVQEAVYKENNRVTGTLSKTGKNAEKSSKVISKEVHNRIRKHKKPVNNTNYKPMDLKVA